VPGANPSAILRTCPLDRVGRPGDVVPIVASEGASWIVVQFISANGDFAIA